MTMFSSLLIALSVVTFRGYVPPHAASDGVRFQVTADVGVDMPAAMRACGIDDFAAVGAAGSASHYQFAVTRAAEANAQCLRSRLPTGSRLVSLDHWIKDAQAH